MNKQKEFIRDMVYHSCNYQIGERIFYVDCEELETGLIKSIEMTVVVKEDDVYFENPLYEVLLDQYTDEKTTYVDSVMIKIYYNLYQLEEWYKEFPKKFPEDIEDQIREMKLSMGIE